MKIMCWMVLGFACTLAWNSAAQEANEGNSGESAVRALEHQWFEAQGRNDNRSLDLIFDNALVYIESGRRMTKGEYLSRVRVAGPELESVAMESLSVQVIGNTAIAVGKYREVVMSGHKGVVKRWRYIDTWVRKNGRWLLVSAAAAPISD